MVKASENLGWLVSIAEFSRGAESPPNLTAKRPRAEHSPQVGLAADVTQHRYRAWWDPGREVTLSSSSCFSHSAQILAPGSFRAATWLPNKKAGTQSDPMA